MEHEVRQTYENALQRLRRAGASIEDTRLPVLDEIPRIVSKGGLQAAERYAEHRETIETSSEEYDPRILARIMRGRDMSSADYLDVVRERGRIARQFETFMRAYDAVIMPTVPMVAPLISDLDRSDDDFQSLQLAILRNPSAVNMLDGCAISLPCHEKGKAPVGLSLVGAANSDDAILRTALLVEEVLTS
jgi:aspartyl-tRNA(Asn)/glutamyl-tRNA(Gln) amidotransferase subunit A